MSIRFLRGDFLEAQSAHRKALELITGPLTGNEVGLSILYREFGYLKKAHELLGEMRQNDPLNRDVRDYYIMNLGYLGDMKQAEEEYERCKVLFGDHFGDSTISFLRLKAGEILSRDQIVYSDSIFDTAKEHLDSAEEGLKELRRIYSDAHNLSNYDFMKIAAWAAYFGDPDLAMNAMEKGFSIDASGLFFFWQPIMREVRQTPRFKELMREIGLVDYWNKFGWPDICRPLDNGDFECD